MARANSGDSFERKVLEMDTTIRRRIYVTKDEDDGHTNYTDLNIKEQKKAIVVNNNDNAYSADLLAKMDEVRQKSSQSTAAETNTSIRVRTRSNLKSDQNRRRD